MDEKDDIILAKEAYAAAIEACDAIYQTGHLLSFRAMANAANMAGAHLCDLITAQVKARYHKECDEREAMLQSLNDVDQ